MNFLLFRLTIQLWSYDEQMQPAEILFGQICFGFCLMMLPWSYYEHMQPMVILFGQIYHSLFWFSLARNALGFAWWCRCEPVWPYILGQKCQIHGAKYGTWQHGRRPAICAVGEIGRSETESPTSHTLRQLKKCPTWGVLNFFLSFGPSYLIAESSRRSLGFCCSGASFSYLVSSSWRCSRSSILRVQWSEVNIFEFGNMPIILSGAATTLNPETIPTSLGFVNLFRYLHSSRSVLAERLRVFSHRAKKGRSQKLSCCLISSMSSAADEEAMAAVSSKHRVNSMVLKQAALMSERLRSKANPEVKPDIVLPGTLSLSSDAYDRCGKVCAEHAKTFYLG